MIGQNKFTTQPGLENGPNYAGKRPNGCAYCFSDDHLWKDCNRIQGSKNAYARANPQASNQENTTPAQRPPAQTPARRVTVPEDATVEEPEGSTTNNNINENVADYPSLSILSNVVARVAKTIPCSTTTSSSLKRS